ncbi:MAG: serine/threonine-protein kinase [Nannocystaceae bacterium]
MQPRDATPLGDADTVVGEVASPPAASTLRRGDAVGRYLVIEPLGSGGMGVVHAAYDPELDRKVAVKLLHAAAGASQGPSPLLGEAQALARLAHPNVVAVHDAGTLGDRVWLAMELVHGCTLTAWAAQRERHWREVVEVAIAVGRGLAAAHTVGLVHRDVKPVNIMIDEDPRAPFGIGRVRVMDFGLARGGGAPAASTRATLEGAPVPVVSLEGALAGTPAYMAPEQFAGLRADARCDQFSLCAVIWECLWRKRPFAGDTLAALAANVLEGRIDVPSHKRGVPAWLRAAVRRGLERDPQRRFPDMNALVTALQRGQARRRQRQIAVVAASVVLLGAGGFAAQAVVQARRTAACEREGAAIAELWSESRRDATDQALRALPVRYAAVTAERVRPWLDDYAAAWGRARTEACLDARTRDRWTEAQLERASWCLDERRMEFAALVEQLSHADVLVAQNAVRAAASLASVEPCRDVHALERLPPPPTEQRDQVVAIKAELAHAGTFALASRPAEGLAIVAEARAQADALGWPPLRAAALLVEAKLRDDAADYEGAARVGAEAYFEAARIDAWDLAAWVATQLIYTVGEHSRRREPGLEWARHAEMALAHAGASGGVGEARRLRAIGGVEFAAGHFQQAREAGEGSVTLYEHAVGPEHPEVAYALIGVGNALHGAGDYAGALATQQRALAVLEAALRARAPRGRWCLREHRRRAVRHG